MPDFKASKLYLKHAKNVALYGYLTHSHFYFSFVSNCNVVLGLFYFSFKSKLFFIVLTFASQKPVDSLLVGIYQKLHHKKTAKMTTNC